MSDDREPLTDEEREHAEEAKRCAAEALRLNEEMAVAFREGRVADGVRLGGEAVAAGIRGMAAAAKAAAARKGAMH